jgi:hypothetical protein
MKLQHLAALFLALPFGAAAAQSPTDFSGKWTFDAKQSTNVGMMAQALIHAGITQTASQLIVKMESSFNGQSDTQQNIYALGGEAVKNMSPMGEEATTRSHWDGKTLVTEWQSAGSIAGTTSTRVENRYLSADGSTMYVNSRRSSGNPMIIVFTRDK